MALFRYRGNESHGDLLPTHGSNPFTGTVTIGYAGIVSDMISITIHDTAGRLIHFSQESCAGDATGVFTGMEGTHQEELFHRGYTPSLR